MIDQLPMVFHAMSLTVGFVGIGFGVVALFL
jgi:hypothetical protein